MRTNFLYFFAILFMIGCKKDTTIITPSATDKLVLNNVQSAGDSLRLTWSTLDHPQFQYYRVIRRTEASGQGSIISSYLYGNTFVDKTVPYTPYLEYQVYGYLNDGSYYMSNIVKYTRPQIKVLDISPFDVLFDSQNRFLYFLEEAGKITQYNLQTGLVSASITSGATIGFSSIGVYNGVKELYVPRNDGWLFIYNAQSLALIDQINIGYESSSVVSANDLLYISTSSYPYPLKVYSRNTKTLISQSGDHTLTRIKKIPGSNTELIEITINIGPTDQQYYSFSPSGNFITQQGDIYHGDHPLDHTMFEFFPAGNKYITSAQGTVYNRNMTYAGSLPGGNLKFTTFDFGITDQKIYAGTTSRTVEVYSETTLIHDRSIPAKAYPFKLFKDGNSFICVSSISEVEQYQLPEKITIETIQ